MRKTLIAICSLKMLACNIDDGRIEVTEQNELGITSLEMTRVEHGFEVRGYSTQDEAVASIRVRAGRVSDIRPGEESDGTEILLSARDRDSRIVTSAGENNTIRIDADSIQEPSIRDLLALKAVTSLLARETKIRIVAAPTPSSESAYASWTRTCYADTLLTTPLAKQCCLHGFDGYASGEIMFIRGNDNNLVERYKGGYGGCKAGDGSSCSGGDCEFGPLGFSRANIITPPSGGWAISTWEAPYGEDCWAHDANDGAGTWQNVTGTRTLGPGCCPDGSGPCDGDFPTACTSCGGLAVAGTSSWDY